VRAPQDHVAAVAAVELGHGPASLNPSRVSGNGNHILEDYVFGEEIEEVPAVNEACQSFLDDSEEGVQRRVVADVDGRGHFAAWRVHACAFRRAKSWKV